MTNATLADTNTGTVRMTAGERAGIPPRRMDFEFTDETTRYWYGDNA
ncbi:MAG: putative metal-dependent hydrolase, partial [Thalassolituus oleivorans]